MSAFEVCETHIHALLTAGLRHHQGSPLRWLWPELSANDQEGAYEQGEPWGPESVRLLRERQHTLTIETAGRVGAMLATENRRSVDFRYDETEEEDPYVFTKLVGYPDPVIMLKAIGCYRYQSCEHPEWEKSEAYAFCQALEQHMISFLSGYDDGPGWEIQDPKVFCEIAAKAD